MKTYLAIAVLLGAAGGERLAAVGGGAKVGRSFEVAKNKGNPGSKKPRKPKKPTSEV